MKDPKRYALMGNPWEMVECSNGNLVSHEDYAALKRRFEICEEYAEGLERFIKSEAADIKRLKAKVEALEDACVRLTKAGDALATKLNHHYDEAGAWGDHPLTRTWKAAKGDQP